MTAVVSLIKGAKSLLLILPKEVAEKLDIENNDKLNFEVKNRQLIICKNHESETFSDRGVGK